MNKKILTGLVIGSIVASVAFASSTEYSDYNKKQMTYKKNMKHKEMNCKHSKYKSKYSHNVSYRGKKHGDYFSKMFRRLDLSKKQRFEISILRDEMKLELKKLFGFGKRARLTSYITNDGFDAKAYKEDKTAMSAKMISIRADYMQKMFKVLTKEQIAQFKKKRAH